MQKVRKLELKKESLRELTIEEAKLVNGGRPYYYSDWQTCYCPLETALCISPSVDVC